MTFTQRFIVYLQLMRFNKPIGILLLLWPTLWALWIAASGWPNVHILIVFVLGVVVMRAAGCVINDIADRHIDEKVKRTKTRPLAQKIISLKEALVLFFVLILIAFILVALLNSLSIILAAIGVLLATIYPFLKRHTHLPQAWLGIAFSWGIPMAFAAQTQQFPPLAAWLLFLANLCWVIAYDTEYAMVDREDDLKAGVKSTAILFGTYDRLYIPLLQLFMIALLICVGIILNIKVWFYTGLLGSILFMCYQNFLIRHRKSTSCFQAFLNNHWIGLSVFVGIFFSYP